jgi:hypothetical protein
MKNYRYFPELYRYFRLKIPVFFLIRGLYPGTLSGDFIRGFYPGILSGDFIRGFYPGILSGDFIKIRVPVFYEPRIYIFEPHGGNEEKVTLLTFNGTNYWGKTGLTVQKPTLIISNHNYH